MRTHSEVPGFDLAQQLLELGVAGGRPERPLERPVRI